MKNFEFTIQLNNTQHYMTFNLEVSTFEELQQVIKTTIEENVTKENFRGANLLVNKNKAIFNEVTFEGEVYENTWSGVKVTKIKGLK